MSIFSLDSKNILKCITREDTDTEFMNYNNYQYKKILATPLHIIALTHDHIVRCYGCFVDLAIDYTKYFDVEDIGYVKENDDEVVIKNGKVYSLFGNYDYSDYKPNVILHGNCEDIMIITTNNNIKIIRR